MITRLRTDGSTKSVEKGASLDSASRESLSSASSLSASISFPRRRLSDSFARLSPSSSWHNRLNLSSAKRGDMGKKKMPSATMAAGYAGSENAMAKGKLLMRFKQDAKRTPH